MNKTSINEFVKSLRQVSKRLYNNVHGVMYEETLELVKELQDRSPIDKDEFRRNWRFRKSGSQGSVISSFRIENKTRYGVFLDQGAEIGGEPWYFPNPNSKPSGKLKIDNGMVWAGGKSPSGFVFGGIIDKVIYYNDTRINKIANKIAEAAIGSI